MFVKNVLAFFLFIRRADVNMESG